MILPWLIGVGQFALVMAVARAEVSAGGVYPVWRWVASWTNTQGPAWMTGSGLAVVLSLFAAGLALWSFAHPIIEEEE